MYHQDRKNTVHRDNQDEERVDRESYRDESEASLTIHRIGGEAGAIGGIVRKTRVFVGSQLDIVVLLSGGVAYSD